MDVDVVPESSGSRDVTIEPVREAEQSPQESPSSPMENYWPKDQQAEASGDRQVSVSSLVDDRPAASSQEQDAGSQMADDMETEDEEDRWSRRS